MLKRVSRTRDPNEKDIAAFLSSDPAKSHPRNHSVPLYEAFDVPQTTMSILVMPVLHRFDDPEFETVGEVLECFRQVFEVVYALESTITSFLTNSIFAGRGLNFCTSAELLIGM